ncbi:hypothetical protein RchiOBHm_Chr1g0342191 [Rosa chinensis]|uniref:Uncharacterized protein n=1 Tax=Rosa chinensis TaxID=74649 RepID=A0A2P6SDY8_ROSCH|nr:hypothetical protein RchiOBHm_Chr1g0342191 [Rosa chinensis]
MYVADSIYIYCFLRKLEMAHCSSGNVVVMYLPHPSSNHKNGSFIFFYLIFFNHLLGPGDLC